ncbi:MAG: glycosyltransferase family 2 protein [Actinomycetota bacterium]
MSQTPSITVVVPYHNEQDNLEYLLGQLVAQTLQPQEVILVNSSSTDASSSLIDEWISRHQKQAVFKNLNASTKTPGGSKSAGVEVAKGDLLAFMDCGLSFPPDWLERQFNVMTSRGADWVSGVCLTTGVNLVDKSAIAHTYGYRSARPVIPSSLVRRSVFDRIGLFKDLRAGYDAEWARLANRAGLRRLVNAEVTVRYRGVNFAVNIRGVLLKSLRYARPSVGRSDSVVPYVYVSAALIAVFTALFAPQLITVGLLLYAAARVAIASRKSKGIRFFLRSPLRLLVLVAVGAVMDTGKLLGFAAGLYLRFIRRQSLVT